MVFGQKNSKFRKMIENYINKVINGDCVEVMREMPDSFVDLIVTSPPYGVNIKYDVHDDDMEIIYNPKECVILAYKKHHIKKVKGEPQWKGEPIQTEEGKTKMLYTEQDKKEFMELVFGQWKYLNDSRPMTKATFSMDIPTKAIKILSYKNDVILDPFNGSGTSCVAAETLDRRWIGIELSHNYAEISRERIQSFINLKKQQEIEF